MGDDVAEIAGADVVSTTSVAPLSEGGGSSSAGCFSGVVAGVSFLALGLEPMFWSCSREEIFVLGWGWAWLQAM